MEANRMENTGLVVDTQTDFNVYAITRLDLENVLDEAVGKTLGEADSAHVFDRTLTNPKITGIAGDVVEQSILGYPANSRQEPDLIVDGESVELKTTGLRKSKRTGGLEAKEPMSITAVSLDRISSEEFESSAFFHKIRKMLIVYYLYDSDGTVKAAEYADFTIKGYQFHEFSSDELEILKNDWQLVHDFIERIQTEYPNEEDRKKLYPDLSSALRQDLMFIDTAPKYPHPPRFRLKRSVVTNIARKAFGSSLEQLPQSYTSYSDIDRKLHELSHRHSRKTLQELATEYGVANLSAKNTPETVVVRMFDGYGKMSEIELFSEIGLLAKTVTLTKKGLRTEDLKFFPVDFSELSDPEQTFEESSFYSQFAHNQFLFVVFEEPDHDAPLAHNELLGFKRFSFSEQFIQNEVRPVWEKMRQLILENKLKFIPDIDRKTGQPKRNANGEIKGAPNFPKSKDGAVFVRGTGRDSTDKPLCINGIRMYHQNVWVKGSYIAEQLGHLHYL